PMLATLASGAPEDWIERASLVYEPKLDGIRILASIEPDHPSPRVTLRSRLGNDKSGQFPELVKALRAFARGMRKPLLLDGELVALDADGEPVSFLELQSRIHVTGDRAIETLARERPVAFVTFDLLRDGGDDLRGLPLGARRARLESLLATRATKVIRLSEQAAGDGRSMLDRAIEHGWEGLIAKDASSRYESGRRSPAWLKLKLVKRQEFVLVGWTQPQGSRQHLGALAVAYYDGKGRTRRLRFAGMVGTGFNEKSLSELKRALAARAVDRPPVDDASLAPKATRWVRPELVGEIKFAEWTRDGVLRHPVFLGLRTDKKAAEVVREDRAPAGRGEAGNSEPVRRSSSKSGAPASKKGGLAGVEASVPRALRSKALDLVVEQLRVLEDARRDGEIALPGDASLPVTNLHKVYWPRQGYTKGDLLRYYARISPWLLPVVADRPLVMKRYPDGVTGKSFYQHRAPDDAPASVRVEEVEEPDGDRRPHLIGGDLATLLYNAQLGAISLDPWFSTMGHLDVADMVAIDLDPMPGVPFSQVRDVARAVGETLDRLGVAGFLKTSGSSGLHIFIPMPPGSGYDIGQTFCQLVATFVAGHAPSLATVERTVRKRGHTVYVDYLQNIQGKTLACAYSVRANEFAGVSTPLDWDELDDDVTPEDFTLASVFTRWASTGDLWQKTRGRRTVDLHGALEKLGRLIG
ncbi:MAG: DNA ligase D, partial [Vicinamibacteraceae bacterium]|nr:DNA ligase D [Vicinamibacteraceae bacterium]